MTVPINYTKKTVAGDGATTEFSFDIATQNAANMEVLVQLGTDPVFDGSMNASISIHDDQETTPGGTFIYPVVGSPLTTNDTVTIQRRGSFTQPYEYINNEIISAKVIEAQLDLMAMERQELNNDLTSFENEVEAPLPLPPVPINMSDVIRLRRPLFSKYSSFNSLRIDGGAIYTYGVRPLVLTVGEFAYIRLSDFSPNQYTTYYIYINDNEVESQQNTFIYGLSDLLTLSEDVPTYVPMKNGFYNGNNKCIFAVNTDIAGVIIPFVTHHNGLVQFINTFTQLGGSYYSLERGDTWHTFDTHGRVPAIAKNILVSLYGKSDWGKSLIYVGSENTETHVGHLAQRVQHDSDIHYQEQDTTNIVSVNNGLFTVCHRPYTVDDVVTASVYATYTGWYLPMGL